MLSAGTQLAFARPGALWLALAIAPVVLLYFLRMRFRRKEVGSVFIWKSLAEPTTGGASLRRRSVLLLCLQVAAIAAAAIAAAGPSLLRRELELPGIVLALDCSASMASRDRGSAGGRQLSRVEAAVEAASATIDALGDGVPIMAFACAQAATPLLPSPTRSKAEAKAALRGLAAGDSGLDEATCADGIAAWLASAGGSWSCRLFTDGGLDLGGERLASAFGEGASASGAAGGIAGGLAFEATIVGHSGASAAVGSLRLASSPGGTRAEFSLWNGHKRELSFRVRLTRNRSPLAEASLRATPGWSRQYLALASSAQEGAYELSIERGSEETAGAPGERCFLSVSKARKLSVILVGRDDPFIKAALANESISYSYFPAFPSYLAESPKGDGGEYPDIAIVDSSAVPAGLRCNLLVFGSPPPDAPLSVKARVSGTIAASGGADHPLSRLVDWDGAAAEGCLTYAIKGPSIVLATTSGAPSIVAWEKEGYRCMASGVDLARSDLGLKSAFPVLLLNFLEWCSPRTDEQSAYTLAVGEVARRLEPEGFRVKSPSVGAARSGPALLLSPRESGLFEWESGGSRGYIAANVPASELDIAPAALSPIIGRQGLQAAADGAAGSSLASSLSESSRPLGRAASALLALLLAAEWIAWRGGSRRKGGRP